MKKLWNIICVLLLCNIVSLSILTDDEHEYATAQNACIISQQHDYSSFEKPAEFTIIQQPASLALAANNINNVENNTSVKSSSSNNGKFTHNDLRKYIGKSHICQRLHNSGSINFSRAIDHYIYEFRHIII